MKLNPFYTWDYPYNLGRAYYSMGRYTVAVEQLEKVRERNPTPLTPKLFLIASYVRTGRQDDAEWLAEEVKAMPPRHPLYDPSNQLYLEPGTVEPAAR